jgi:hypothetical protein
MKRSTFTILFYVKRGDPKQNGNVSIMGRITIDGERAQFSTKLEILPDGWDCKGGRARGNGAQAVGLNRTLDTIRAKAVATYNRMMDGKGYAVPEKIKNALLGIEEKGKTIVSYFDRFNEQYRLKVGTTTSLASCKRYELSRRHLTGFLKQQHGVSDYPYREIDTAFLDGYFLYFRNTVKAGNNYAVKHLQMLRTIFDFIKNNGESFIDPFAYFRMSKAQQDGHRVQGAFTQYPGGDSG